MFIIASLEQETLSLQFKTFSEPKTKQQQKEKEKRKNRSHQKKGNTNSNINFFSVKPLQLVCFWENYTFKLK